MESDKPLSVTEINELVKTVVSTHVGHKIYVKGELSNIKKSNGHLYFTLKDSLSNISGIFWRFNSDAFNNGDMVTVGGKITFFSKQGTYQITATEMDKCGTGDINTKYQKLKDDFDNKGYFSKSKENKEFPKKIRNIGILTAAEGAALQDILYVLNNNNFMGNVYVKNSIVQGNGCSKSVKDGIQYFNNMKNKVDILVIARGGGSDEDLMGYSTEDVVKSIHESTIFTISAIGHEIDFMLSDFAADFRAPTPSIAGETIIKEQKKEKEKLLCNFEKLKKLEYSILSQISGFESKLNYYVNMHKLCNPINFINNEIEKIESIKKKIKDKILHNINDSIHELDKLKIKNSVHNIKKITKKGYVIITDENDNLIENSIEFKKKIKNKDNIKFMFNDGEICLKDI
jgi:exodeoxyribonuclease VII large subunit